MNNNSIGKKLARLRRDLGLSQKDLAQLLTLRGIDITNQAISKWEKDVSQPNAWQFLVLCRVLRVEDISGEFLGGGISSGLNHEGQEKLCEYARLLRASGLYAEEKREKPRRVLPLYDLSASAGTGQLLDDSGYAYVEAGEDVPEDAGFGVRIAGDSMEPHFSNGQIVWVRPCETLSHGEIGIFLYDGNAYLKLLAQENGQVRLRSLNKKYEDICVVPAGGLRILGKAL